MGLKRSIRRWLKLSVLGLLCLCSCGGGKKENEYRIALDPSWYPLNLMGMETKVIAFSQELLLEIARIEKLQLVRVDRNWDNLVWGLKEKKYEAILSSMRPYLFREKKFDFSELYLKTGPVLVIPLESHLTSLDMMNGKMVGVVQGSSSVFILEKNPSIFIKPYDSIPGALNDIAAGAIEGALVPALQAAVYCQNLYATQLKVATDPLDDEGLRLITLYNENKALMEAFNKGLKKLQENGRYEELRKKWDLPLK